MSQTRVGLAPILSNRMGSVTLPEEITLYCPQCGTEVADKGQCLVEMRPVHNESSCTGFSVQLVVDCRNCGCSDRPPAIKNF